MSLAPVEFPLELMPRARVDVIDVRHLVSRRFGDALDAYPKALCCSFHTTAGYLDQSLATRLHQSRGGVMSYINVFRTMFPEGAGYEHDKIDRRTELNEEQKPEEQQKEDSHMEFMAGARGRGTDRAHIGSTLRDPFIDYKKMAEAYGVASEGPITDPNQLRAAFQRGIASVKAGKPYLIDVITQPR